MRKVLVVLAVLALSGCWRHPGHDPGRSYWNDLETAITVDNVDNLALLWQTAGSSGLGAVDGGTVYVRDGTTSVSAIDAATGAVRWTTDLATALGVPDLPGFALVDGPVVSDDGVFMAYTYAISIQRWSWARLDPATGTTPPAMLGSPGRPVAQPIVVDGRILQATSGPLGNPGSSPLVAQFGWTFHPTLFLADNGPRTGPIAIVGDRVLWSLGTEAEGFSPACPPYGSPIPSYLCRPDWTTELGGIPTGVAKVGTGQAVYTDDSGTVTVLDVATGAVAWTAELGSVSRPAVVGDTIFVGSSGQLAAFPAAGCGAATCAPTWTAPGGSAAIAGGDVVYTASGGSIVAYDKDGCGAATCEPLATLTLEGTTLQPQIVDGGRLYAAAGDGRVVAFGLPG